MLGVDATLTRVAALISALSALTASPGLAQQRVIPPGHESDVAALVLRGDDGAELEMPVTGVQIESARIVVTLGDGAGSVGLVAPDSELDAPPLGRSTSFSFWLLSGSESEAVRRSADRLCQRIRERDEGTFWGNAISPWEAEPAPGAEPPPEPPPQRSRAPEIARRIGSWLLLACLLAWLLYEHRERLREKVMLVPLSGFVAASALRLGLPPWAPLHANDHGISELRGLAGQLHGARHHGADLFGDAHGALLRSLLGPTDLGADGVLLLGAIFGAASIPLLWWVARLLFPDRAHAGALAAGALVFHPAHIRLSLSESPRPLAMSLFLLGVALGIVALRSRIPRRAAAACLAAALALGLAAELRLLTMLIPPVALAFVLVVAWRRRPVIPWPALVLAGAALIWTLADHTAALMPALRMGSDRSWDAGHLFRRPELLVHFDLTPVVLTPLALIGAVLLWRGDRRREVAASLLALLFFVPSGLLVAACRTDWIRYQTDSHLLLILLLAGLAPRSDAPARRWLLPVSALVLLLASAPGLVDVVQPDVHAQAYEIARQAPDAVNIVTGPMEMEEEPRVRAEFPDYLLADPSRVLYEPRGDSACVVWVGVGCWSFTREEVAVGPPSLPGLGAFREECVARLGGPHQARSAVAQLTSVGVPHRDQEFHEIPAQTPRVGFVPCASITASAGSR